MKPSLMNLLLIVISVAVSLFVFTLINKQNNHSDRAHDETSQQNTVDQSRAISDLRREISRLSEKIASYDSEENSGNTEVIEQGKPVIPEAGSMETKEQITAAIKHEKEKTAEYFNNFSDYVSYEELDPAWANDAEKTIYDAVVDDQFLIGSQITSVDCRSTVCRTEVMHDSKEDSEKFSLEFLSKVSSKLPAGSIKHTKPEDGRYMSTVYLVKTGHAIPVKFQQ